VTLSAREARHKGSPNGSEADPRGGVTWRAAAISLVVILVSAPAIFYGEVVWRKPVAWYATGWSSGVPASWPLAVLFLLGVAASLPMLRRWGLTRQELLTVYCVVLVTTPLFSISVLFWALSQPISYYYFGQVYPQWQPVFLSLIPTWFSPSSSAAVDGYFLGQSTVPWSEWAVPLAVWSSFICAVFLANLCLISLVQRQWITHERLTFPLAQIPLETVASADSQGAGRLGSHRIFWLGLSAAFFVTFLSSLSQRIPALPALPLLVQLMRPHVVGPMAAFGQVDIAFYPWLLAIAYLIPKDVSFSVWSLWLVRLGLTALAIAYGAEPESSEGWWRYDFPAPYNQVTGAVFVLSGWALWRSWKHLSLALRTAFGRERDDAEAQEPLPYRWALAGFVVCFAWLVWFFVLAGCRLPFAAAFSAVIVAAYLSYARLQAEAALDPAFWWFNDILIMPVGGKRFLPREFISLYTAGWVSAPMPSFVLSSCSINALTAFKIADSAGIDVRRLTRLLIGGFFAALLLGIFVTLTVTYRIGFLGMTGGTGNNVVAVVLRAYGHGIYGGIQGLYDAEPSPIGMLYVGMGAIVCLLLAMLRLRFLWWPFHPVGYVLSNSLPIAYGLCPFFLAWIVKVLVTRYGGLQLYRTTVPVAIGLIVGDMLNLTLWNIVALATQGRV
jgi:hypothetical protein